MVPSATDLATLRRLQRHAEAFRAVPQKSHPPAEQFLHVLAHEFSWNTFCQPIGVLPVAQTLQPSPRLSLLVSAGFRAERPTLIGDRYSAASRSFSAALGQLLGFRGTRVIASHEDYFEIAAHRR